MKIKSFGKYAVIQPLGSGGMAAVYEARDALLDRRVAIKIIHPHLAEERDFASRFRQEARLVAALRHPHIVRLYDFDILNDQPYMVMEYLDGGTLKDRLSQLRLKGQRMPLGSVAQILKDLAGALDYAHAQGAVHRDIKPANILFTSQDEPVITDFGIVKLLHESAQISHSGGIIGTPAYMSPEQVSGKPVDGRSDQYSLAIMIYEMITGHVPFAGDTAPSVLMKHLMESPPAPRSLNPNLPASAEVVLLRALEKEPSARFSSTTDFANAFAAALQGLEAAIPKKGSLPDGPMEATEVEADPPLPEMLTVGDAPRSILQPPTQASLDIPLSPAAAPPSPKTRAGLPPGLLRRGGILAGALLLLVLSVVLFISLGGLSLFPRQLAAQPGEGKYSLAIANFDGSQASIKVDFGRRIFEQLENELADLGGEIRLTRLDQTYTAPEAARSAGQEQGLSIVIWGWYDDLGVSPHVEVIQPPAPSAGRSGIFLQTAHAAGLAEKGGAAQVDLGDFFSYLRVPHRVDEMNLFVQNGPEQVAYIAEAVLALAYQYQGQLDTAMTLYDKALTKAAIVPPAGDGGAATAPGLDLLYLQRGIGLVQAGRLAEAVQDLEQARTLNPKLPEAHYNLAILYAETCSPALRTGEAVASAEEAVRLRPDDPASRRLLAGLFAQKGNLDQALEVAQAALESAPEDADTHLLIGSLYEALGKPDEARASFEQAYAILQDGLDALQGEEAVRHQIALGDAYLQGGQIDQARQAYQQAQSLNPDDASVHRGLGSLALQAGQLEDAAREFQRGTELDPANGSAFVLLGLTSLKQGQEAEMLAAFEKASSLAPCDPDPHLLLGGYYWMKGDQAKAEAEYSQAAKLEPDNASSLYLLGVTQHLQGHSKDAKTNLSQAIALDPKLSKARYALASLYYDQGDYARARDEFQLVAKDDPGDASALISLGNALDKLGEADQAIAAYEEALKLQEDPNVHAYLGLIYYQQGEMDLSIQEYRNALQIDPQMSLAYLGLGDALEQSGDLKGAAEAYRQALSLEETPMLRSQLAALLTRMGSVEDAILELKKAVGDDPQNPILLRQIAALYARLGRLDEAQEAYQALVSLDESSPEGYLGLGQLAYKRCDLSGMSQNYAQAATLGADIAFYVSLPASAYAAQGDSEGQSQVVAGLLEKFSADPLAQILVGEFYLGSGKPREAEDTLQTALQAATLPPLFQSLVHYDLGQIQLQRGNASAAEGEFHLALEKFPSNAAAQIALGDLALRTGNAGSALQAYDLAEELLPEYGYQVSGDFAELLKPILASRRMLAQTKLGVATDPATAIDLAQAILNRTPQWPQAHYMLGLVYYTLGQVQEAQAEFAAALPCDASLEQAIPLAKADLDRLK